MKYDKIHLMVIRKSIGMGTPDDPCRRLLEFVDIETGNIVFEYDEWTKKTIYYPGLNK